MYDHPANDPVLQDLFDPDLPNRAALWAVLEGSYTGKAMVDQPQHPSQCVLRTDAALSYFSHETSQAFLDEAIAYFIKMGPVWLVWPAHTPLHPPEAGVVEAVNRLEFYEYEPHSEILSKLRRQLPEGYTVQGINRQLFERCEWRAEMEFYAGGMSSFLEHGMGLCMMRESEIVAEAYASSLGKTIAEIGAITREVYRGLGFAPIASAYLIEACEQRGYHATWSCDANHKASIRVAQKLGFQCERAYTIYEYGL
jgi:RimJ/RimL family protein N-acetyltransferase